MLPNTLMTTSKLSVPKTLQMQRVGAYPLQQRPGTYTQYYGNGKQGVDKAQIASNERLGWGQIIINGILTAAVCLGLAFQR